MVSIREWHAGRASSHIRFWLDQGAVMHKTLLSALALFFVADWCLAQVDHSSLRQQAVAAMKRAGTFYANDVASHGGYVYYYDVDLKRRWGEGEATPDQIWVQPPGTPTVGLAFLSAYDATGDVFYLSAAQRAAKALVVGQLKSGGWTNCVDFDPAGKRVALYRLGGKRGKNNSSLDDGQTQSALTFLIRADEALGRRDSEIHEAAQIGLESLLAAQFPCGGFPQVWTGPSQSQPIVKANFPAYDWRTEGRIKEYWNLYTLNDNVAVYAADTLLAAHAVYKDPKYLAALERLGEFLLLAQLPEPQPAWAQQYNYQMQPVWARRFEPPAVSGHESQHVIRLLMKIYRVTGEKKFLAPIPAALDYLSRSELPGGQLARYYELKTNRPLYMERRGDNYSLTYRDDNLPRHYGWKMDSQVKDLRQEFEQTQRGQASSAPKSVDATARQVKQVMDSLSAEDCWISTASGERLVGQPRFAVGQQYISSEVFSANMTLLADYLRQVR